MVVAATITLLVFAFPVPLADLGPGPTFYYRLIVYPADVTLTVAALAAIAALLARGPRPGTGTTLLFALTASLAVALVFHPSAQGLQTVARFAGATALSYGLSRLGRDERILPAAMLGLVSLAEVGLGLGQMVRGAPLGLPSFGEVADPLLLYGSVASPRGTLHALPLLAGLGLVAAPLLVREGLERVRATVFFAAGGLAAALVGMTFSRGAALGLALAVAALVAGLGTDRRRVMRAAACLVIGAAIPAALFFDGWQHRATLSVSGRDTITEQAWTLIAEAPLTGVGPGRSVFALAERFPDPPRFGYQPGHALPLVAAVEGGVIGGALAVALLVTLGWRARRDLRAVAIFVAFLPAVLTDHYTYTYLQGQVLLAIWVGTLDGLAADPSAALGLDPRLRRLLPRA